MTSNRIGVELYADINQYNSALKKAESEADNIEKKLGSDVVDAANRAERALNNVSANVSVKIGVDDQDITTLEGRIDDLGSRSETIDIDVNDGNLTSVEGRIDDIGSEKETLKVDADTTGVDTALAAVSTQLKALQTLSVINLALNIPGSIANITETAKGLPVIGNLIEIEEIVKRIQGQTGLELPGLDTIIRDLQNDAWGDSPEQLGELLTALIRADVAFDDLGTTAVDVFEAAAVSGQDPLEIFTRMDTLVRNKVVPTFGEASDLISFGFQQNLDRGQDFLDTLDEYLPLLAPLGISAGAFLEIMSAGTENGARNLDKLADGWKELLNLTVEEVTALELYNQETDRTRALGELGLLDEAQAYAAGEITGDQFGAGILDGLRGIEDKDVQALLARNVFGASMVEEIGMPALLGADLSPETLTENEQQWMDAATAGANIINDTLSTAITELSNTLENSLVTALDNAFDIKGQLDKAKKAIQVFAGEIESGTDLGAALEIALEIPGFADSVSRFESGVGNFLIAALELIAGVQDFTGGDSASTREEIARLAGGQLAFDLQVANPEEVAGSVQKAIDRGVDTDDIAEAAQTAVSALLEAGDTAGAEALINSLEGVKIRSLADQEALQGALGIGAAQGAETFFIPAEIDTAEMREQLEQVKRDNQIQALSSGQEMAEAITTGMQQANIQERMSELLDIEEAMQSGETAAPEGLLGSAFGALEELTTVGAEASTEFEMFMEQVAAAAENADERVGLALTGNTMTEDIRAVATQALLSFPQASFAMMTFGFTTPMYLEPAKQALMALRAIIAGLGDLVGNVFGSMNANLQQAAANATAAKASIEAAATAATGQTGTQPTPNAQGGVFGAGDPLLFEGGSPEIITFNQPGSVIGIRDTRNLLAAVTALSAGTLGAPMTADNSTRSMTVVNNNVVQSLPQADLIAQKTATAIRGF